MGRQNKNKHNKGRECNWCDKVNTFATVVLAIGGFIFGYYQSRILKTQTDISQSLRDHQIRAVLEVSFSENHESIWIRNVGELAATKIEVNLLERGRGIDHARFSPSTDINPGDRIAVNIPVKQKSIECKNSCEGVALDLVLRYAWAESPRMERIHQFFWVDALNMWTKGQYQ